MLTRFIGWSLNNRFLVLAFTLMFVLLGLFALQRMAFDVFPEFAPPQVVVQTEAPGMAPTDVEILITYPLESAINGTPGVSVVRSKTVAGLSTLIVVFKPNTDIYRDRQLINERIQNVVSQLPLTSKAPVMLPVTSAVGWLIKYALISHTLSPQDLRTFSDWEIRPRILALGGIASVVSLGGELKQYQVLLDPRRMVAYGITAVEVKQALMQSNINVPGAFLQQSGQEMTIAGIGRVVSLNDIKKTIITIRQGVPITIANVAQVTLGGAIKRGDAAYGLQNAVIGTISKNYGADTLTTTYKVAQVLNEIKAQLPKGIQLKTEVFRQANFIEAALHNLTVSLIQGGIIVIIVLFIFLMNWRASFITFLSIPISFVGGILILSLFGIGINAMTLGGLAIAIGEVVDNGIITVENVVRRLRLNHLSTKSLPAIDVVFSAVSEILNSVVYATLIIILIFVPVFFLQGMAGRIFSPLGIAYIASVTASLAVAVTVLPCLCYLLLVRKKEKKIGENVDSSHVNPPQLQHIATTTTTSQERETRFVLWLKRHFLSWLQWSLQHVRWVLGIAIAMFIFAISLLPFFGKTFLPEFHEGNFIISMTLLPGTSLTESMRVGKLVRQDLLKYPQVISITQRAGRGELDEDAMAANFSEFDVKLDFSKNSKISSNELLQHIREDLSQIPGAYFNVGQFIAHRMDEVLSGVRSQVAIKVFGEDLATLSQLTQSIQNSLKTVPGVVDINREQQLNVPQLAIKINREKAARYGLTIADVADTIQLFLNGETISSVVEGNRSFDLFVRLQAADRDNIHAIQNMLIDIPATVSEASKKIPLRAIAHVSVQAQPYAINRENVQRVSILSFNVQDSDLGRVIKEVQQKIKMQLKLPTGYYVEYGGQFESQQEANRILFGFGSLALLATIMLLYKVFGTFREAFLVMFNLPLALIGGIIALFLAGANLSVAAMVGFITLFGIAMRNGIILVTHYNQLRQQEKPLYEVVIDGTLDRLVPVLMTAATAALGLMPLLWGSAVGKELERPLAQVVLGGLLTSTLLNMIVIPTLYYVIERWREKRLHPRQNCLQQRAKHPTKTRRL